MRLNKSESKGECIGLSIRGWKIMLYILVCVALTPILLYRDFTPSNELRYLSIVDESLRNMTFWSFTNHGIPYADKPPLYFWGLMLCRWLAGNHYMILMALLSLIPGLVTLDVMDRWSSRMLDVSNRKLSLLTLLTCAFFIGMMVVLRMDMLMTMFIVLSLRSFWRLYCHYNPQESTNENGLHFNRERWLFGIYLFLALFSKGPLGILIPLCSTIVFLLINRRIRQFFHFWGWRTWTLLLGLCIIWFGSVFMEGGQQYLDNLLFHQTIDRAVNSFHHDRPFWYYLVSIWYIIAPWCLLIIGLIVTSLCKWRDCSKLQQFYLTVSVTTFVLLSCISAKLQVYMLPAVPYMAYGAMLSFSRYQSNVWLSVGLGIPAAIYFLALPAYLVALNMMHIDMLDSIWFGIASGVLSVAGIAAIMSLCGKNKGFGSQRAVPCLAYGLLLALFCAGWGMPSVNEYTGYRKLCEKALEIKKESGYSDIYTYRISRPENMDVYLHQDIIEIPKDSAAQLYNLHGALLMLPQKRMKDLPALTVADSAKVGKNIILTISDQK